MATPEPTYQTLQEEKTFAIRAYPATLVADVVLPEPEGSPNAAFRMLADYIFKERPEGPMGMTAPVTVQKSIGMTAPVTVDKTKAGTFMRFYMPARYTLETLPRPEDARIHIHALPARHVAVVQFSWWMTEAAAQKNEADLRQWMTQKKLKSAGTAERQFFNPPWSLPWNRRNEIWIPVQQ